MSPRSRRSSCSVEVAGDLLDAREDHRVGLSLFAGTGRTPLAPPIHDHRTLRFLLGEETDGTAVGAAPPGQEPVGERLIVLITDGEPESLVSKDSLV